MPIQHTIFSLEETKGLDVVILPVSRQCTYLPDPYNQAVVKRPEVHKPFISACKTGLLREIGHLITQCRRTGAVFILLDVSKTILDAKSTIDKDLLTTNLNRIDRRLFNEASRIVIQSCTRTATDWAREIEPLYLDYFKGMEDKLYATLR